MIFWVDEIKEVVDMMRATVPIVGDTDAPYYLHGHPIDVMNQMQQRDKHDEYKFKQWPLIALFQDFDESYGDNSLAASEVSLNIIIATVTSKDFTGAQRYDASFRPTLQPLYELFISKLIASGKFMKLTSSVPHTKTDRLYWGTESGAGNTANKFPDYIDAIEISDLNLKLRKISKCK